LKKYNYKNHYKEEEKSLNNFEIKVNDNFSTQYTSENITISNNITPYSNIKKNKENLLKQKENNFYNQFWMNVSDSKENIDSAKFIEIIKILLSSNHFNIYYKSNEIKRHISFAGDIRKKKFICPLTKKEIPYNKIWSMEKLIKDFIELFSNERKNDFLKEDSSTQFIKNNERNSFINSSKISNIKKDDFLYRRYKNKNKNKLEPLKKNRKDIIQDLSFQSKTNQNFILKKKLFNKSQSKNEKNNEKQNKININNIKLKNIGVKNLSIFEKLYNQDKINREKKQKLIEDNLIIEKIKSLEECTFKPRIITNHSYKKSFNEKNKPKGYEEYKHKNREAIAKAEKRKIEKNR
jgi:hypothetical protein